MNFAAFKAAPVQAAVAQPVQVPAESLGKPLYTIPLVPLLNNIRGTRAMFRAGNTAVHVFGNKSENKGSWVVGFAAEDGALVYKNAFKMLRYEAGALPIMKGSAQIRMGGRDYNVYVEGRISNRMQSQVIIEPLERDTGEDKAVFTIEQLSNAAYLAGYPVRIGGVEYRLLYSEDFNEGADGQFSGLSGDRSLVLLRSENGKLSGFHWYERELPRNGVLVETPRAANSDDGYDQGRLTLGLGLTGAGELRIYYPVDPTVASR
jgi:hypothetical protein